MSTKNPAHTAGFFDEPGNLSEAHPVRVQFLSYPRLPGKLRGMRPDGTRLCLSQRRGTITASSKWLRSEGPAWTIQPRLAH
jgi:hypothetical protein